MTVYVFLVLDLAAHLTFRPLTLKKIGHLAIAYTNVVCEFEKDQCFIEDIITIWNVELLQFLQKKL